VEFNREEESSDEADSQDRQLLDDSSQPHIAPVCEYAWMDAELGSQSEPDIRVGRRTRGKRLGSDQSGDSQLHRRRRSRVIMSPSPSLEAEGEANEGELQSAASTNWGEPHDADEPTWVWDDKRASEELREYFSVCRIDPLLGCESCRESTAQVCSLPEPKRPSLSAS
jgi:hypothetical protein